MIVHTWRRSRLYRWLRLNGYVAFDLPRTVTGLGSLLLLGIAVSHAYVMATQEALPRYFVVYCAVTIAACVVAAGAMWLALKPRAPQLGWFVGDLVSVVVVVLYFASRAASLPGLTAVTGRWDFAPATFAFAFAGAFVAVHMSVLLGINVAYPQRQGWHD
ncbi:hypothetical protein [Mycobacterium xenopi]|uniref:hypothetical protein n=1 Tax=Mycobacterium xenopi TaxID=1789 RepID=UPI0002E2ACC6|nr:hypothetical protein [Mycobacterium xenopi]